MKQEVGFDLYLDYKDAVHLAAHIRFRELSRIPSFCHWFCKLFTLAPAKPNAPFCGCSQSSRSAA